MWWSLWICYFTIPSANPNSVWNNSKDRLLFNYSGKVDQDSGIATEVFEGFKTGPAAIVAGEYNLHNGQIEIIKEKISKVIAVRTIYFLQKEKAALQNENMGNAFHHLSEGYGFLYSLRFTNNPLINSTYLSKNQVDDFKQQLSAGNGFWDMTPATLYMISQEIAAAFGITV